MVLALATGAQLKVWFVAIAMGFPGRRHRESTRQYALDTIAHKRYWTRGKPVEIRGIARGLPRLPAHRHEAEQGQKPGKG